MSLAADVQGILAEVLQTKDALTMDTTLLGGIAEFDSMAVVTVLTEIEDRCGILVDDDEVDASIFETVGTLVAFLEAKQ